MSPVDTGQMTPPVPIPGMTPTQGGAPQSPALGTEQLGLPPGLLTPGMPTQIPGQPIHRPSFLQAFLANLGPALGTGFAASGPNGEQNFGTGLAGGFAGVQNYQQKQFDRAQQIQAQQRLAAQQISEQMLQGAQTANLTQEMRNRQKVADYFTAPTAPTAMPSQPGAAGANPPQSGFMQDVARQHEALGQLSPDEEAQFGSGVAMAARTQDPDSFSKVVTKIVEDRKDRAKEAETARHNRALEQNQSDRPELRTVQTGKGVFQWNPETGKYDKYIGPPQAAFSITGGGLIPGAGQAGGSGGAPATIDAVPNSIRGRVQAIINYRAALPPAGRNNPTNNAISYWVNALDPQHDETNFPARNKLMTAFTSGKESQQINAINTAMGHVGVLGDAVDALNNGDVKVLNKIANGLGVQTGSTPVTTFNTIVHRVGPELASAYIAGGGGEHERGTTGADFDPNLGTGQLKSNVAITAKLLRSKIGALENQYKQTMQRDDFQQRFITPEAQQTLDRWSPRTGGSGASGSNKSGGGDFWSQFPEHK